MKMATIVFTDMMDTILKNETTKTWKLTLWNRPWMQIPMIKTM